MKNEEFYKLKDEYFKLRRKINVMTGLLDQSDPNNLVFRIKHPIGVKEYLKHSAGMNPYFTMKIEPEYYEEVLEYASKEYSDDEIERAILDSQTMRHVLEAKNSPFLKDYEKLPEDEKYLVQTKFMNEYEFVDRWITGKMDIVGRYYLGTEIKTENNEEVYTQQDKEFADMLRNLGIVYYYIPMPRRKECGAVLPRFIVLNLRTREDFYFEHYENVKSEDQMAYVKRTLKLLERKEIFSGKNYFYTTDANREMLADPEKNPIVAHLF